MADTIRTLAELNTMLADNTAGDIDAQDLRDMMVSLMCHAEIGSTGQVQEVLAAGWQAVKLDQAGAFQRGFTLDAPNMKITGTPVDMKVIVSCEVVFRGTLDEDFEITVFKNPDGTPAQIDRLNRTLTGLGTTRQAASWETGIALSAGDELQMAVRSSGSDWKLDFGRLAVRRIGVE